MVGWSDGRMVGWSDGRMVGRGRSEFEREDAVQLERRSAVGKDAVQLAIERLLEVIEESASAMSESARSTVMYDAWDDVRRLRIVLAHHYHRVDPDQVWSIATTDVPALAQAISVARPDLKDESA